MIMIMITIFILFITIIIKLEGRHVKRLKFECTERAHAIGSIQFFPPVPWARVGARQGAVGEQAAYCHARVQTSTPGAVEHSRALPTGRGA